MFRRRKTPASAKCIATVTTIIAGTITIGTITIGTITTGPTIIVGTTITTPT
jgi:hypothetical protein